MASKPTLEETIEVASKMKERLQAIHSAYERMPRLIEKEHDAIKQSKIEEVEKIAQEKIQLGDVVQEHFAVLKENSEHLANVYESLCGSAELKSESVSDCIKMFEEIARHFKERGFGAQVFDHVLAGFSDVFHSFLKLKEDVRPIMERNSYVLSKLLFHRQENFRFWQEVMMESQTPYNKSGKQKTKHQASIVAVKA